MRTAKVVLSNYPALLHDFPHVFGADFRRRYGEHFCTECARRNQLCLLAVDRWLIDNAAFVSHRQAQPNTVNSAITHGPAVARAYRPPGYGRALVMPIDAPAVNGFAGMLDLKGVGVSPDRIPSREKYSDGLEYLGVALADFLYGWLIDRIFARTVPAYGTVPVYAVLDLGFDIVDGWHGTGPAGIHVRRAHARPSPTRQLPLSGSDQERIQLHIALLLRSFGLSTGNGTNAFEVIAGPNGAALHYSGTPVSYPTERHRLRGNEISSLVRGSRLEIVNVQLANGFCWNPRAAQLVDFGHFTARRQFSFPTASIVRDGMFGIGHIIRANEAQPEPSLAIDADLFGRVSTNAYGFYLAQGFRKGMISRKQIEIALRKGVLLAFGRNRP